MRTGIVYACALLAMMGMSVSSTVADEPAYPSELDSAPVTELMRIAYETYGEGWGGFTSRLHVAACLEARFLATAEGTRAVTPQQWRQLTLRLAPKLLPERRATWADRLKNAFAAPEVLSVLAPADVFWLAEALGQLGDTAGCKSLAEGFLSPQRLSSLDGEAMARLAAALSSIGEAGHPGHAALTDHVTGILRGDPNTVRAVTPVHWQQIVSHLQARLLAEPARQAEWAQALKTAFAGNTEAIRALDSRQAWCLMDVLHKLEDADRQAVAVTWLEAQPDLAALPFLDVQETLALGLPSRDVLSTWIQRFETSLLEGPGPLPFDPACIGMAQLWLGVNDNAKAGQWIMRAYQVLIGSAAARETATMHHLNLLSGLLGSCHLNAEGTAYPAYAEALRLRITQGELHDQLPWDVCWHLARGLCSAEARDVLRQNMLDANGLPRAGVVMVLSSAYAFAGQAPAWQAYLDEQIARTSGDAKAKWLLAGAILDALPEPRTYAVLAGRQRLDQALGAAESPALRTAVLTHLAWALSYEGRPGEVLPVLDSLASGFAGTAQEVTVNALRSQAVQEDRAARLQERQLQALIAQRRTKAWQTELRRRIEVARARSNQAEVARLEQLLGRQ